MGVIFASRVKAVVAASLLVVSTFIPISTVAQVCTPPPSGLVSWWPGDGDANDFADGNHGTLRNGATFDSGLVGQALRFTASRNSGFASLRAQVSSIRCDHARTTAFIFK